MKAVIRNLALNPYGAPTVFMTGGWMNLKRVCHRKEPSSSAEISSRTAGFSCNLNKTRSAGFKGLIAVSMYIAAKNTMIATSYPSTRFSVSRWCESKGLSSLLDILSVARWEIWCVWFCLALLHYKQAAITTIYSNRSGQQSMTLLGSLTYTWKNVFGLQGHHLALFLSTGLPEFLWLLFYIIIIIMPFSVFCYY